MIEHKIVQKLRSKNPEERRSGINEAVDLARRFKTAYYDGTIRTALEVATRLLSSDPIESDYVEALLEIMNQLSVPHDSPSDPLYEIIVVIHLRATDPEIREKEIETLVKHGDIALPHRLTTQFRHIQIAEAVAEILTRIGSPSALRELEKVKFILLFRDPDATKLAESISSLAQNKDPRFVQELSLLLNEYDDASMYNGVIQTLGEIGTQEAIAELVRYNLHAYWEDSGPAMSRAAAMALAQTGAACIKPLSDGIVKYVLGDLQSKDWRLSCAADTLAGITDPNAAKPLMELYKKYKVYPRLQEAIRTAFKNMGIQFDG